MSLFKNVSVVSYNVIDWEKAKKFYSETLEWSVIYGNDEIGWIEYGTEKEAHIAINRWEGPEPIPSHQGGGTAVLTVDDAVKVTEILRARGVQCNDAVNVPGVVCFGTMYDPEGNRIQFASNPT